jgi:ornithine cyclodeaminase/alanine dehydrogenase-like protein (mu-crystallin family)
VLLLSEEDVRAVLPMEDLIGIMDTALQEFSAGRVVQPVRLVLPVGTDRAFVGVMPAVLNGTSTLGAKLVTVYEGNRARGLPSHLATIVLLDYETGALAALVDGRFITESRTAAVSAVSAARLARPNAGVLGILGSGVQARSHLEALKLVRPLTDVRVWSPDPDHRAAFARAMTSDAVPVRAVASAAAAARDADIIVLATSSRVPVIDAEDIRPGTHICAVGACRPDMREMPSRLVARGRLFVDSRAAALRESGDVLLAIKDGAIDESAIHGELGDVLLGRVTGRLGDDDVTIFKSLGLAVEDLVAARHAVDRAIARGLGRSVVWS